MSTRSFLLGIGVGAVLASGAIWLVNQVDRVNSCVHEVVREFPAPYGKAVAIVVLSGCHATAPDVTSVAIRHDEEVIDFNSYDNYLFAVRGKNNIEVEWHSAKTKIINTPGMTITYDRPTQIYRQMVVSGMEPISYVERQ